MGQPLSRHAQALVAAHEAGIRWHEAAILAITGIPETSSSGGWGPSSSDWAISSTTLWAVAEDRRLAYVRARWLAEEEAAATRSARGGRPAERRPPEEQAEDWALAMQERQDYHEEGPRP